MIGKTLGRYQITSQIGKGGMGEVYQAKDQKLGRDVAIKVLPEEFAKDADRVARFQREAMLLASLNHTNVRHPWAGGVRRNKLPSSGVSGRGDPGGPDQKLVRFLLKSR